MGALLNGGLVVAHLALLILFGVQYRRGRLDRRRLLLLGSVSLTWLSYGLLALSGELFGRGTPALYLLDGVALVVLATGLYGLYRGVRDGRGEERNATG